MLKEANKIIVGAFVVLWFLTGYDVNFSMGIIGCIVVGYSAIDLVTGFAKKVFKRD